MKCPVECCTVESLVFIDAVTRLKDALKSELTSGQYVTTVDNHTNDMDDIDMELAENVE
jgi:hypothetical protein